MDFGKWGELIEVFLAKNAQINLSAIRDAEGVYVKHVLDSLELMKVFSLKEGQVVCDLGTGGGFPLLPLAIENPEVRFVGMDARKKKIDAIASMVESLKQIPPSFGHPPLSRGILENVDLVWSRVEEWSAGGGQQKAASGKLQETLYLASNNWIASSLHSSPQGHFLADAHSSQGQIPKKFDVVMARAVAHVEVLIPWMMQIVQKKGTLILYKEYKEEEKDMLLKLCQKYKISIQKEHKYVLEGTTTERVIYILG